MVLDVLYQKISLCYNSTLLWEMLKREKLQILI